MSGRIAAVIMVAVAPAVVVSSCGASTSMDGGSLDAGPADSGLADGGDSRQPDAGGSFVQGPHAPLPLIPFGGGALIAAPEIVTITFQGDSRADTVEAFGDWVATSDWLALVGADYGVGKGHHLKKLRVPFSAPSSLTDADVQTMIEGWIQDGGVPAPPSPTSDIIYVVYFPTTTVIDAGTLTIGCGQFGDSYHSSAEASPSRFAYAVVLGCPWASFNAEQAAEIVASHELIEAMTNPYAATEPGFAITDPNSPWAFLGGETADFCSGLSIADAGSGFAAQTVWSNSRADAGLSPCIPSTGLPYFNTTASADVLPVAAQGSVAFPLQGWSEGPTPAWRLAATPIAGDLAPSLSFDRTSIANGGTAMLTVTAPPGAAHGSYSVIAILSSVEANPFNGPLTWWVVGVYVP
jgi:hypothetical protein